MHRATRIQDGGSHDKYFSLLMPRCFISLHSWLQVRANDAALMLDAALPMLLSGHAAAHDIVVLNIGLWHFDEDGYR